jgi:probable phosphoglycerate mutase
MHVYAIRHGESEYNLLGLCNDDPDRLVHLTEKGRQQAEEAAVKLRRVALDGIFCSRLPRARQTAEIVARYHRVGITPQAALNDIRTGCDGRSVAEYFRLTGHDRLHTRVGDGESLLQYKQRILDFLAWLGDQQRLKNVLLVAHEETLRVFAAYAGELSDTEMMDLNFSNCEIFEFEL